MRTLNLTKCFTDQTTFCGRSFACTCLEFSVSVYGFDVLDNFRFVLYIKVPLHLTDDENLSSASQKWEVIVFF